MKIELAISRTTYEFPWAWVNGHTTVAYELPRVDDDRVAAAELRVGGLPSEMGAVVLCSADAPDDAMQRLERFAYVAPIETTSPSDLRAMFEEPPKRAVRFTESAGGAGRASSR